MDDQRHDTQIRVKFKDRVTGEERWTEGQWVQFSTWWWTDGNGSCDCNRRLVFRHGEAGDEHPCESIRYIIVEVDPLLSGYSLADFNQGYP